VLVSGEANAMDSETAEEIKRHVTQGLRELGTEIRDVRQHSDALAEDLRTEIRDVRQHSDVIAEDLRTEIQDVRQHSDVIAEDLRTEIQDVKRHSDVIAESLRGEIRTVAEGVVGLREEFSLDFKRVFEEFRDVRALIRVSYGDLDRRVQSLEKGNPS
jgi:archaellum component FlaC